MKYVCYLLIAMAFGWLTGGDSVAQSESDSDMIYQANASPLPCIVSDVQGATIKYKRLENLQGPDYVSLKQDVLLVFKSNGDFMLPGSGGWIKGADAEVHKIITQDHQIFPAKYVEVKGDKVSYVDASNNKSYEVNAKELLVIIYKDGKHKMFADASDVAAGLEKVTASIHTYSEPGGKSTPAAAVEADGYINLTEEQLTYFAEKAEQKGNDMGKYLRVISDKTENEEDKLYAIKAAITLFLSDTSKVEVSSLNRKEKRQFYIGEYLERLRLIPYDKVELAWFKAQFVSRFRKGEDGKYYGMLAAQQLFRGYLDNKVVYQDVTEKNIEVVLARYEVFDAGVKKQKWDVFLSDISVQQTREK